MKTGIVRNVENNLMYAYLGEDKYQNLITGKEGIVAPETAQKIFRINVEATYFYIHYQEQFLNLVKTFNLKIEK